MSDETTDDSGMGAMDATDGGTSMMGVDDGDTSTTGGDESSDEGDSHMEA